MVMVSSAEAVMARAQGVNNRKKRTPFQPDVDFVTGITGVMNVQNTQPWNQGNRE